MFVPNVNDYCTEYMNNNIKSILVNVISMLIIRNNTKNIGNSADNTNDAENNDNNLILLAPLMMIRWLDKNCKKNIDDNINHDNDSYN